MNLILILGLLLASAWGSTFTFRQDSEGWGSWGSGISGHDPSQGYPDKGSIKVATDWGETQTIHYNLGKMKPGLYKISAYVRAESVRGDARNFSFWHFFDVGQDTQNVFTDLSGSYEWRRIEYTVRVKDKLLLWFRLKSPGIVWIDNVTIEPVTKEITEVKIASPIPLKPSITPKDVRTSSAKMTVLLDFDKSKGIHPFSLEARPGNKLGKMTKGKYYNFKPTEYLNGNWEKYDRISLDVYNNSDEFVEFYLTLGDDRSRDYWTQLNHKTYLAPGKNQLNFSLKQFIGERGSHKHLRSLNLKSLKKWFIIIDPNSVSKKAENFSVDNISLISSPHPLPPEGVWSFDFTSHKDLQNSALTKVNTRHDYDSTRGFGFVEPSFWRVEDAVYAPESLRYSIGLLKGGFRVKLPNGKYQLSLDFERLGYWDVSFWKNREIYINGKIVFKETRTGGKDFLGDYLRFENIVPSLSDHPYDLYLKQVFRPKVFNFEVKNGMLDLFFEGDPTGINLNRMVVWKADKSDAARSFISALEDRDRTEFNWMSRSIPAAHPAPKNTDHLSIITPKLILRPDEVYPSFASRLDFFGGKGETPFQLIQVGSSYPITWELEDIKSPDGKIIPKEAFSFYEVIPQYISPDLNHESYFLGGKYLKPSSVLLPGKNSELKFLLIKLPISDKLSAGEYTGAITFKMGSSKKRIPLRINLANYLLPQVDFPVGFFGPDPLPFNYVYDLEFEQLRQNARSKSIKKLGFDGFTTFTGFPDVKLIGDKLDISLLKEVLELANSSGMSGVYFSYGGSFPFKQLESNDSYYALSQALSDSPAKIVHTYSDEPGGYSDKIQEDLDLAKKYKEKIPELSLGGFTSLDDSRLREINSLLDYPFFSKVGKKHLSRTFVKRQWGSYNASPGNLSDPRFSFGPGLFYARSQGLRYYLEWHASAVHNFPYYDFDGRESDVTMFMPSQDGSLYPTLRYELAVQGIQLFKKLKLLENILLHRKDPEASKWLREVKEGKFSSADNILVPANNFDLHKFQADLNSFLFRF